MDRYRVKGLNGILLRLVVAEMLFAAITISLYNLSLACKK